MFRRPTDPASLRVLSLDLDDTLWDVAPVIEGAERALREWLGRYCPRVTARYSPHGLRALRDRISQAHPDRTHDLSWMRLQTLEQALGDCGYPTHLAGDAFEVFLDARNRVSLHADVLPALEALHRRYTLVALTNGNADLERVGLGRYFDHYLCARGVGAAKPDPRMFQAVAEATGHAPAEVLHIGDDPERDVVGAARAGMVTAWVNRRGDPWPVDHPPPDTRISELLTLSDWLLRAAPPAR
ncbi:MAG: HAD-IA family hydrolase [Gammaproteobacteria bacterium]|nr:HAD-IA family hydrolase [Gammaproteobacteria bacterium]TVQ50128.1 MAG: HAD family hydrolase [Gammaproteobacteria bacterium]